MKKALLIGINYNNDDSARLYGCINDVISLGNMLMDAYSYEEKNITILRDDEEGESKNMLPTKKNIINNINTLINESPKLRELWIHYSGHGSYINDNNNDERDRRDEVILPSDFRQNGIIVDDLLRSLLNRVHKNCLVYITMDCCHSGSSWDLPYTFPIYNRRIYRSLENRRGLMNSNVYMLSGSRDNQTAADSYNYEERMSMGAFTMGLIKSLRSRNHNVSLLQLYVDITLYLERNKYQQRCVLSSSSPLPYIRLQKANTKSSRSIEFSNNHSNSKTNPREILKHNIHNLIYN